MPLAPVGAADDPPPPPEGLGLFDGWATSWTWKEGLHFGIDVPDVADSIESGELRWRQLLRSSVGIRLAVDAVGAVRRGGWEDTEKDVGVRRGYLWNNGSILGFWKPLTYKLEVGVVDDSLSLKNASLAIHEIPWAGTFRIGAFDPPMSLSMLTSSRATPLMERGMPIDALVPGTLSGFSFTNHLPAPRVTWAIGLFSESTDADVGDESDAPARVVGRLTWLPWRTEAGFLHVGASGSAAYAPDGIRYAAGPESFFAPDVVDTGVLAAERALVIGLEAVWVRNRLSVQAEYLQALALGGSDPAFEGAYVMASWFLTEDTRRYVDDEAAFGSVVPASPVSWSARQIGAFEVAARCSFTNLADGDVRGGTAIELMSGLNWYLNRYVRLQFNVGWAHTNGGPRPGDAAILQTRFDLLV